MTSPWSPFVDPEEELTARLQRQFDVLGAKVRDFVAAGHGPVFVSTPDLRHDVPGAIWLPVVVDLQRWQAGPPVLTRDIPVLLHAPSRASLKGSALIETALRDLHDRGIVEYRRLVDVPPEKMPETIHAADIVLDQFALGTYGVMACEAMASERVVVSYVLPDVREHAQAATGRSVPVVEATPDRLAEILHELLADRDRAREIGREGRRFVQEVHDGRLSARLLAEHMHMRGTDPA